MLRYLVVILEGYSASQVSRSHGAICRHVRIACRICKWPNSCSSRQDKSAGGKVAVVSRGLRDGCNSGRWARASAKEVSQPRRPHFVFEPHRVLSGPTTDKAPSRRNRSIIPSRRHQRPGGCHDRRRGDSWTQHTGRRDSDTSAGRERCSTGEHRSDDNDSTFATDHATAVVCSCSASVSLLTDSRFHT